MLSLPPCLNCLRCYVCGGNSGTPCKGPEMEQSSSLIGIQDPVQECNDLINNRGCVKQYVNGVVLLRGCWLDGTNKCLRNGAAEVCTCSKDLCNSSRPLASSTALLFFILLMSLHNSLSSASWHSGFNSEFWGYVKLISTEGHLLVQCKDTKQ